MTASARSPPKLRGDFDSVRCDLIGSQLYGIKGWRPTGETLEKQRPYLAGLLKEYQNLWNLGQHFDVLRIFITAV
jgi:hypothetical protein